MDIAATVARYEQALQSKHPLMFRIYPSFPFYSTSEEELLRERLFHLVQINNSFHILDVETAEDAAIRIEFDLYAQTRSEWKRYDHALRTMHPDLLRVYEITQRNVTLEKKLEQLKRADEELNFMAEYEAQKALEYSQFEERFKQLKAESEARQALDRLHFEESFEQLSAEYEVAQALDRLQLDSADVIGPALHDH